MSCSNVKTKALVVAEGAAAGVVVGRTILIDICSRGFVFCACWA